jgi:hypothetical protein
MFRCVAILVCALLLSSCGFKPEPQIGLRNYQAWGSNTCCGEYPSPVPTAALGGNSGH